MIQRTYQTRLPDDLHRDVLLDAYAELAGRVERTLFARLQAGGALASLKRAFLVRFGLTARQFNAVAVEVRAHVAASGQRRCGLIGGLQRRLARAEQVLASLPHGSRIYHQKRRRVSRLHARLAVLAADQAAGRVRLCFGSRRLFRKQFALAANGYASHRDWRKEWDAPRSGQFFVLGSKDETAGYQGCVAIVQPEGTLTLRLRLPNGLAAGGTHLLIPGVRFAYGHDAVAAAIGRNVSATKAEREAVC